MLLAADKNVAYGEVVKVIDLLTSLGLHKVSLETRRVAGQLNGDLLSEPAMARNAAALADVA